MKASQFALSQDHALLQNMHLLKPNPEHPKKHINFLTGDPTQYGHEECRMTEEGYEIMRKSIHAPQNHSYVHSAGTAVARQAIVKHFNNGKGITVDDVLITSGVNQGLLYCLWACCDPGSNILVPELGYPFFDGLVGAYGVEVRKYKLKPEQNWEIDLEDLSTKIDEKTAFLFVINPSNPCGSVFSKEHMQQIVKWAQDNCILLVADEVYYGMSFSEFISFGEVAEEGPIICLSGMEKIFFVPGWQTAWVIFYDKNKYAEQIKKAFFNLVQMLIHSNVFIMNALPDILDKLTPNFGRNKTIHFKQNQDYVLPLLESVKGLKAYPAQGTFYVPVLLDLSVLKFKNDTEFSVKFLEEENVSLLPLSWSGSDKYQGFRLMTIANKETYDELVARLKQFLSKYS